MNRNERKVAVVIPCFNCQDTIGRIIIDSKKHIGKIIVVDDGSSDDSYAEAKKNKASVIRLDYNQGVGKAIQAGMKEATRENITTIVLIDADGAHDPKSIPGMLKRHWNENFTMTIGNRWNNKYSVDNPSTKWWANVFAANLIRLVSGHELEDVACGFRVINLDKFALDNGTSGYGYLYEMIFSIKTTGEIGHFPIKVRYDASEILGTNQKEFLELLVTSQMYVKDQETNEKIGIMINQVSDLKSFSVRLKSSLSPDIILFVHCLPERKLYFFQYQHSYFSVADTISFEEITL